MKKNTVLFFANLVMGIITISANAVQTTIKQGSHSSDGELTSVSWPDLWQSSKPYKTDWHVYSKDVPYGVLTLTRAAGEPGDTLDKVYCNKNCLLNPRESQSYPNFDPEHPTLATMIGFYGRQRDEGKVLVFTTSHTTSRDDVSPQYNLYYAVVSASKFPAIPPSAEKKQWRFIQSFHASRDTEPFSFCIYVDSGSGQISSYLSYSSYFKDCTAGGEALPMIDFQVK